MKSALWRWLVVVLPLLLTSAGEVRGAKVDIKVEHDKDFSFVAVRSWAWHPEGAGVFKMAVTADDDSAAARARYGPVIEEAITQELASRGLVRREGAADLYVTYYALISASTSAQTMGQFLPATGEWGLPPFQAATTAFRVFEQGSLVVDLVDPAQSAAVWRAVAKAEMHRERPDAERNQRLRTAIRDMLRKYPAKQR